MFIHKDFSKLKTFTSKSIPGYGDDTVVYYDGKDMWVNDTYHIAKIKVEFNDEFERQELEGRKFAAPYDMLKYIGRSMHIDEEQIRIILDDGELVMQLIPLTERIIKFFEETLLTVFKNPDKIDDIIAFNLDLLTEVAATQESYRHNKEVYITMNRDKKLLYLYDDDKLVAMLSPIAVDRKYTYHRPLKEYTREELAEMLDKLIEKEIEQAATKEPDLTYVPIDDELNDEEEDYE